MKQWIWRHLHGAKFLMLLLIGHMPSHTVRVALYRLLGMRIGAGTANLLIVVTI